MGDTISKCFQAPNDASSSGEKQNSNKVKMVALDDSNDHHDTHQKNKYRASEDLQQQSSDTNIPATKQRSLPQQPVSSPLSSTTKSRAIDEDDFFSISSKTQQQQQERVSIFGDDSSNQIISLVPVPVLEGAQREDAETRKKYFHCVVGSEDGDLALYCPKTRKVLSSSKPHKNEIMHLRYNTKSRFVYAASRDKSISVHQITSSAEGGDENDNVGASTSSSSSSPRIQMKHRLEGHTLSVTAIDINQDDPSFLVSGSRDNTVRLWDCAAGRCVDVADVKLNIVHCVKWIPALQLVAQGGEDLAIRLWDIRGNRRDKLDLVDTLMGFDYHPICCDIVGPDQSNGHVLVVGHNGFNDTGSTISFWDLRMKKLLRHCEGHSNTVRRICSSQTTPHIVTGSDDQTMKLWRGDGYPTGQTPVTNNSEDGDVVSSRSNNNNNINQNNNNIHEPNSSNRLVDDDDDNNNYENNNNGNNDDGFGDQNSGIVAPPNQNMSTQQYNSLKGTANNNNSGMAVAASRQNSLFGNHNNNNNNDNNADFTPVLATEYVQSRIASLSSFVHPDDNSSTRREVIIAAFRTGEISTWSVADEKLTRLRYLA